MYSSPALPVLSVQPLFRELISAGHQVLGLARSDAGAERRLSPPGAEAHRGDLEDLESLRSGAAMADGVIHTAFIHDFSKFRENCEIDRRAIEALGSALAGSDRPLVVTSGTGLWHSGRGSATEDDMPATSLPPRRFGRGGSLGRRRAVCACRWCACRRRSMATAITASSRSSLALPARKAPRPILAKGVNRWPAVHRLDAAHLFRLVLEKGAAGARYHGVAEGAGVPFRDIAGIIGRRLNVPVVSKTTEEAAEHFGWFAHFAALDYPSSSERTRDVLGWQPTQPGLLADLDRPSYFEA